VGPDLLVHLLVEPTTMENRVKLGEQGPEHQLPSARKRSMIRAVRFQLSVSTPSCFLPAADSA
jgi:hypothetical protein